jgi:hypothetical protein
VLVGLVVRRLARGWVSAAVLVVLCAAAGSAWASFPGRNGAIGYSWVGEGTYRGGPTATSIRAVDPRSGRVRVLQDCPVRYDAGVPNTDCQVLEPRYSPDGLRIGFPSARRLPGFTGSAQPGLTTMVSDGTGLDVQDTEQRYWELAWAPAGDRFLLVRQLGPFSPNAIFLASLDGTELSQVTPEPTQHPDWSLRGQIAFTRSADPCPGAPGCDDIYVTRLGGTERRLTYRGGYSPSWSPRGKKLAFVRSVSGRGEIFRGEIFLVGRDGRGLRRLTYRGGYSPVWSPDGKRIAFIRDGDIYVTRTNGRGLRRLVDAPTQSEYGEGPQVTSIDWQALPRR